MNFLIGFSLLIFSSVNLNCFAGEEEDAFLIQAGNRINIAYEELYYRFTDLILKQYCGDSILAQSKSVGISTVIDSCEKRDFLLDLQVRFDAHVSAEWAGLMTSLEALMNQEKSELTFSTKEFLANQMIEAILELKFREGKILTLLVPNATAASDLGESTVAPLKKLRCLVCKKKLGLTPFDCRCGGQFCSVHRLAGDHTCSFDYRKENQDELVRRNPVVKGEKLEDRI